MLYVTLMLLGNRKQLDILIWVVTFSVAFYGIKGGIWTVLTGGGGRVWGPPGGLIQGNNELAVALVMLMPMLAYLHHTTTNRWLRHALVFCMASVAFAILGSQSRGALLALVAMLVFLGIKGKNPIRTSLLLLVFAAMAISFMPDTWTSRMDTMGDYQQDASALSRIWTWKTMWAAALDHPLVGVGFSADNCRGVRPLCAGRGRVRHLQGPCVRRAQHLFPDAWRTWIRRPWALPVARRGHLADRRAAGAEDDG